MKIGVILAGGKGVRLNCQIKNKTALKIKGKPLIQYGVDLFKNSADKIIVVVGAYAKSVKNAISDKDIYFVTQGKPLGTGHAAKVAVDYILQNSLNPDQVFVGYGDHMMFYTPLILKEMSNSHLQKKAAITLISTIYDNPNSLAWGRIIRDNHNHILAIIEQKEATVKQRQIKEVNAGFYCFNFDFLAKEIYQLKRTPLTHEYYLTDLIDIACQQKKKVVAYQVPFKFVGPGVNTKEQLELTRQMIIDST